MRRLVLIILGVAFVAAVIWFLILRPRITAANLPSSIDIKSLLPNSWVLLPQKTTQCDFDGDAAKDPERLVLYRYDPAGASGPSLIGGVILHTEVNRVPQDPGVQSPYRPAFVVPYKLLPDIYESKGQGYLGEDDASITLWPASSDRNVCTAREITIYGIASGLVNRLSLFRWNPGARSYEGVSYVGGLRLISDSINDPAQRVVGFTSYDRFNDRSWLCQVRHFSRPDPEQNLQFSEDTASRTIDFCYGPPVDPAYPEAVIVRMLRYPAAAEPADGISDGYFLDSSVRSALPNNLAQLKAPAGGAPFRILTLRSQGIMTTAYPAQGHIRPTPAPTGDTWWQSDEQAEVQTVLVDSNGNQGDWTWRLAAVASENMGLDTHWRIVSVAPTQP